HQIPWTFGIFWCLDFEQVHFMHHRAVGQDLAIDHKEVIERHLTELLAYRICSISARGLDCLQVRSYSRVGSGMDHRRHGTMLVVKALRPLARSIISIPIECRGELQALSLLQTDAFDIL